MRLRASNSSLLRISPTDISLQNPAIVLFSSSPALLAAHGDNGEDSTAPDHPLAPAKEGAGPGIEAAPWSRLSLEGGTLALNVTASTELEAPGASLRLVGRRCSADKTTGGSGDCGGGGGGANGENMGRTGVLRTDAGLGLGLGLGEFVADADAVLIRARSASAGVAIVADGASSMIGGGAAAAAAGKDAHDSGDRGDDDANAGGRIEVKPSSDYVVAKNVVISRRFQTDAALLPPPLLCTAHLFRCPPENRLFSRLKREEQFAGTSFRRLIVKDPCHESKAW